MRLLRWFRWTFHVWIGADLAAAWQYLMTGQVPEPDEEEDECPRS